MFTLDDFARFHFCPNLFSAYKGPSCFFGTPRDNSISLARKNAEIPTRWPCHNSHRRQASYRFLILAYFDFMDFYKGPMVFFNWGRMRTIYKPNGRIGFQ